MIAFNCWTDTNRNCINITYIHINHETRKKRNKVMGKIFNNIKIRVA